MSFTKYLSLAGKTVLVTGGASGIGAVLVEAFAEQGATVAFIDKEEHAGRRLEHHLRAGSSANVHFVSCDVTDVEALQRSIHETLALLGTIHILVNNVANDQRVDFRTLNAEEWRAGLAVNLDPVFFASQAVVPAMEAAGGGVILNLSSINALIASTNLASYNTAKAGILGLTKSIAREFGPSNVRANAILPGWVVTDRQQKFWLSPDAEAEWHKQLCLKRRILPHDIANLVLFLASDDAACITAQSFVIDAGRL